MKKIILIAVALIILIVSTKTVFAQGMMGNFSGNQDSQTATSSSSGQGDQAGAQIWQQLQNKQVTCDKLSQTDFENLGDYFMGQMMGSAHDAMDQAMTQRLGENGDTQMHIAMGERFSGCNPNAAVPGGGNNYFGMMGIMGGFGGTMNGLNPQNWGGGLFPMTSYSSAITGWRFFAIITWILVIVFLLLGIIYFWRGINKK